MFPTRIDVLASPAILAGTCHFSLSASQMLVYFFYVYKLLDIQKGSYNVAWCNQSLYFQAYCGR